MNREDIDIDFLNMETCIRNILLGNYNDIYHSYCWFESLLNGDGCKNCLKCGFNKLDKVMRLLRSVM